MHYSEIALQKVREDRLLIAQADVWLYEEVAPYLGQRILEIGCGLGNFARHFTDRELYVGVENSQPSVDFVAREYGAFPNMHFLMMDAISAEFPNLARFKFDTVLSINVFEHIEDDVTALRNASRTLTVGGHLVLVVPAHRWLYGTIDRAIGHYRRYSKQAVTELFQQAQLTCVTHKYVNAVGALGWFMSGRVLHQETPPSKSLRYLNGLLPLLKRCERAVAPPFGVSLVSVGRKDREDA